MRAMPAIKRRVTGLPSPKKKLEASSDRTQGPVSSDLNELDVLRTTNHALRSAVLPRENARPISPTFSLAPHIVRTVRSHEPGNASRSIELYELVPTAFLSTLAPYTLNPELRTLNFEH
jgi:hypothetical protein